MHTKNLFYKLIFAFFGIGMIVVCPNIFAGKKDHKDYSAFVQYNEKNNMLYEPSKKLTVNDIKSKDIQKLIKSMRTKMEDRGIGLSANQIGRPLQLFMIEFKNENKEKLLLEDVPFQVFINPKITKASKEKVTFWHGCLSALDKPFGKVATYEWIEYESLDENGNFKKGRLTGMGAIIFQHEFRHLLGKCYFDFAKDFLDVDELRMKIKNGELSQYAKANEEDPFLLPDYIVGDTIEEYGIRCQKS